MRPYHECLESPFSSIEACQVGSQMALDEAWIVALLVAIAPILLAWLLVYIVVWATRWIMRGFQPST